jgi:hypothetical protein
MYAYTERKVESTISFSCKHTHTLLKCKHTKAVTAGEWHQKKAAITVHLKELCSLLIS